MSPHAAPTTHPNPDSIIKTICTTDLIVKQLGRFNQRLVEATYPPLKMDADSTAKDREVSTSCYLVKLFVG